MSVVFACKLIHLKDDLFRATQLDHRLPEGLVADESVVDAVILLFAASPCKLIRRKVIFASSVLFRDTLDVISLILCYKTM